MDMRHDFKPRLRIISRPAPRRLQPEAVAIGAIIAAFWIVVLLRIVTGAAFW